ncbi:MAG: hypothetical protein ABW224_07900, partial [Kibdelosporangium sp.]
PTTHELGYRAVVVLRRSTRLFITLGAVAVLLVVGGIAAASLLRRGSTAPAALFDEPAATAPNTSWQEVTNPATQLAYQVPPDWELADQDESLTTSNGVRLGHLADWGTYTCQGAEYGRAFAASGVAPNDRKPGRAAAELAAAVAADQYSDSHQTAAVQVGKAQPATIDGTQGAIVRAEATLSKSTDPCASTRGTVTVVAVPTAVGNSVLVVAADATPGPQQPTPLAEPERLDAIVSSLRFTR